MIDFSLDNILQHAPYSITLTEAGFVFCTDGGVHYRVSFEKEDIVLGGSSTYQLILQNVDHIRQAHDPKVVETVLAIVDEFFRSNQKVLLYLCDTSDGKEGGRNRLFLQWFNRYAQAGRFTIRTANAVVEGETIYAAIIVETRNPQHDCIISDFEKMSALLTEKP